jgi:hypothetical protein
LLRTFSTAFVTTLVEKRVEALARPASSAHSTAHVIPSLQRASGDAVRKRTMTHRSRLQSVALAGCPRAGPWWALLKIGTPPGPGQHHAQ